MRFVKNIYLFVTIGISALFLFLFYMSNIWICLIPVVIVIADYIRTRRSVEQGFEAGIVYAPFPLYSMSSADGSTVGSTSIGGDIEFIKEEEFKV